MQLGSGVAVAVALASICSSDLTSRLGTSLCHGCGLKKQKKKKNCCDQKVDCGTAIFLETISPPFKREQNFVTALMIRMPQK